MESKKTLLTSLLFVVAIAGILGYTFFVNRGDETTVPGYAISGDVHIIATESDVAGVARDTKFVFYSKEKVALEDLKKSIRFEPSVSFSLNPLSGSALVPSVKTALAASDTPDGFTAQAEIIPDKSLEEDEIYKIVIDDEENTERSYSWAFQVRAPFQVIATHPRNEATHVPTNTAIEITTNRENLINPENLFAISPKTEGTFENFGSKLVFLPSQPLAEETIYEVTMQGGLKAQDVVETLGADFVLAFETGSNTYDSDVPFFSFENDFLEYTPGKKPVFQISYWNLDVQELDMGLYQFTNNDEFINSYAKSRKWEYGWAYAYRRDTGSIYTPNENNKITSFKPIIIESGYQKFFEVPEVLGEGYYLLDVVVGGKRVQAWLQVSQVTHYFSLTYDRSLTWLYSFDDKKPLASMGIDFLDFERGNLGGELSLGNTNSEGLLEFRTPESLHRDEDGYTSISGAQFLRVDYKENLPIYIKLTDGWSYYSRTSEGDKYWDYLSTDRVTYQMNDTLRYWGILKGRDGSMRQSKVNVGLYFGNYYYDFSYRGMSPDHEDPLVFGEVAISQFDTFEGALSFKGVSPGYYRLIAKIGDEIVSSAEVQVLTYTKPAYQILVTPRKNSIFAGEKAEFNIHAEFFDGTPVSNLTLKYSGYWEGSISGVVNLDENGNGDLVYAPVYFKNSYTYYPRNLSISFSPQLSEEGSISGRGNILIFGPDIHLQALSKKQEANNFEFTAKLNKVDIGDSRNSKNGASNYDYIGDFLANYNLRADIVKTTYTKVESGQYYDPINKVTRKTYEYVRNEQIIESLQGVTDTDGEWTFERSLIQEDGGYYRVKFYGIDSQSRTVEATAYVSFYNYGSWREFNINLDIGGELYQRQFSLDEEVDLELKVTEGDLIEDAKVLIYRFQNSIDKTTVQTGFSHKEAFASDFLPSVSYRAVVLGPYGFFETNTVTAEFREADHNLDIKISPDKEKYRPGEDVVLDIEVLDKDKDPIAGEVNLSIVDESLFHILPSNWRQEILPKLYENLYANPISGSSEFISLDALAERSGGAEGGGGGDGARSDFVDVALFETVRTDYYGKASVRFTLPDNITKWRVTALAFDNREMKAGEDVGFVTASLPFFVDATLSNTYLSGDKSTLRLRTFGDSYKQGAESEFSVKINEGEEALQTSKENAVFIPLGEFQEGEVDLLISAKQGELKDSIERKINVVDSFFVKPEVSSYTLSEQTSNVTGNNNGFTDLLFMDEGQGKFYHALLRHSYISGIRSDQLVAQYFATQLLNQYFEGKNQGDKLDLSGYHTPEGGISLFPYSDNDLEVTSKIADLAPDFIFSDQVKAYLYESLNDSKADMSRIAKALYGLASLGEPVLTKINTSLKSEDLSDEARLYLSLALAKIGDKESARGIYINNIKPLLRFQGTEAWVEVEQDMTKRAKITATIAVLSAKLGIDEDSALLWNYIVGHNPKNDLDVLEEVLFMREALKDTSDAKAEFSYKTNKREGVVSLEKGKTHKLTLSEDELKSITFSSIVGKVTLLSFYEVSEDPSSLVKNSELSLNRTYLVDNVPTKIFEDGDVVLVRLDPGIATSAIDGQYQVIDYLPGGLKPITRLYEAGLSSSGTTCNPIWYPARVVNNTVYFNIYKGFADIEGCGGKRTINYYARVVSQGEYGSNPALIQSLKDLESLNVSQSDRVEIK